MVPLNSIPAEKNFYGNYFGTFERKASMDVSYRGRARKYFLDGASKSFSGNPLKKTARLNFFLLPGREMSLRPG